MPRYTTPSQVEKILGRALSDDENAVIEDVIETISKFVTDYTGRTWNDIDEVS